ADSGDECSVIEKALEISQLNGDAFKTDNPGSGAAKVVFERQFVLGGQCAIHCALSAALLDTEGDMIGQLQIGKAAPMRKPEMHVHCKRTAGPERIHGAAIIADLTADTQRGDRQADT